MSSQVPKPLLPSPYAAHTLGTHSTVTVHQIQKVCVCGAGGGGRVLQNPRGMCVWLDFGSAYKEGSSPAASFISDRETSERPPKVPPPGSAVDSTIVGVNRGGIWGLDSATPQKLGQDNLFGDAGDAPSCLSTKSMDQGAPSLKRK